METICELGHPDNSLSLKNASAASASHCGWQRQYNTILNAMVDKFIEGNSSANTAGFESAPGGNYNPSDYYNWDVSELEGKL